MRSASSGARFLKEASRKHDETRGKKEPSSEFDTEADEGALPKGSGPRGQGPPLQVGSFERRRDLVDGAGICSLGRWRPLDRPQSSSRRLLKLREILRDFIDKMPRLIHMTHLELFAKL